MLLQTIVASWLLHGCFTTYRLNGKWWKRQRIDEIENERESVKRSNEKSIKKHKHTHTQRKETLTQLIAEWLVTSPLEHVESQIYWIRISFYFVWKVGNYWIGCYHVKCYVKNTFRLLYLYISRSFCRSLCLYVRIPPRMENQRDWNKQRCNIFRKFITSMKKRLTGCTTRIAIHS